MRNFTISVSRIEIEKGFKPDDFTIFIVIDRINDVGNIFDSEKN
jgi:hypothetical protein